MVILFIVFAELGRAYTCRSLRSSIFSIGWSTNTWMFYSVAVAVGATLLLYVIPGLNSAFGLESLDGRSWGLIFGFMTIPMIVDELTKYVYRYTGYGKRPKAKRYNFEALSEEEVSV